LGNEVLLNATLLFIFFILLKISNIRTGCYKMHGQSICEWKQHEYYIWWVKQRVSCGLYLNVKKESNMAWNPW